ncbi:MAG: NAD(P)/FAD-dependent oxidoreductase [Fusobacteriota bacterium]
MKVIYNNMIIGLNKNQTKTIWKRLERQGITRSNVKDLNYLKRSIDSRNTNNIKIVYNLEITLKNKINISPKSKLKISKEKIKTKIKPKKIDGTIAVIGTGPSGLFSALRLAELGFKPLIFERGEKVENRKRSVIKFWDSGKLDEESNMQFGEGGAGTFSDGKLSTGIKSDYKSKVFNEFYKAGANQDILYDYMPHIGTDKLQIVVKNLREKIINLGGEFYFNSKLTDINIKNKKICSIKINNSKDIKISHLVLGIGHSARDTYKMLYNNNVAMENKNFAMGTRIEHPKVEIDKMQYGKHYNHPLLKSASYKFTYNNKKQKRGTFSFCMCPGGEIVNAASEKNTSLVNGMSNSKRDGDFSNSAIVVGIKKNEFGNDIFSGMEYQAQLEKKVYNIMGKYGTIYQNLTDFLKDKKTKYKIKSSYRMNLESYELNKVFPEFITQNLKKAFKYWSKNKKFISSKANLLGVETRTSSPIRILRDKKGESINIKNLYPIGEGAGYAGGIISAAIDGLKIVDENFTKKDV